MAHHEPPHQDLRCLQIQLFASLVVKELNKHKEHQLNLSVSERTDTANHDQLSLKSVLSDSYLLFAVTMHKMHTYSVNANKSYSDQNSQAHPSLCCDVHSFMP